MGETDEATVTVDRRGQLESDPFDHRVTKDGRVMVYRGGRQVSMIAGAAADRLVAALERAGDDAAVQLLLAKATGNYRHGNERAGRQRS